MKPSKVFPPPTSKTKDVKPIDYQTITQSNGHIVLTGMRHFHLAQILDCGQAFRWAPAGGNVSQPPSKDAVSSQLPTAFSGIAHGRRLDVVLDQDSLTLKNMTLVEFEEVWKDYFDLGQDYGQLHKLMGADATMEKALAFSPGLRLMRQDPWEILVSFIISQNSNIPRIKSTIELLCQHFGAPLGGEAGGYGFPTAATLAAATLPDLAPIRAGYRGPYILDAAQRVASGMLDLRSLASQPTQDVRQALLEVHGIGPKVADCILLFGFSRVECFPLDVWMKRVMATYYPNGFPENLSHCAGIAQQFLFHYIRYNQ